MPITKDTVLLPCKQDDNMEEKLIDDTVQSLASEPTAAYGEETIELHLPKEDMALFRELARKMGWLFRTKKKHLTGMEEAEEDIRLGRVFHADNVDDMFKQILG